MMSPWLMFTAKCQNPAVEQEPGETLAAHWHGFLCCYCCPELEIKVAFAFLPPFTLPLVPSAGRIS